MTDQPQSFPTQYKKTTTQQWDAAAKAWDDWGPTLHDWLGPVTELMFDLAGLRPGSQVLDVAAGAGEQTVQAAGRVGPTGRVLATDISPRILERAAANARRAGLSNVECKVLDGENLDVAPGAFDAVISRVGLITSRLAEGPRWNEARAQARWADCGHRLLDPGPESVLLGAGLDLPAPRQSSSAPAGSARALQSRRARHPRGSVPRGGFADVQSRTAAAPLRMKSAKDCLRFEKESFGALHQMLSGLDQAGKDAAWEEIEEKLRTFETPADSSVRAS